MGGGAIVKVERAGQLVLILLSRFGRCQFRDVAGQPLVTARVGVQLARKESALARRAVWSTNVAQATQ